MSFKTNLNNVSIIRGSKGFIKINEPWLPSKNSSIEVSSNNHFYIKSINSKMSIYANQIEKVSQSFNDKKNDFNLFNIEKSFTNMKLINNWLNNEIG